MKRIYLYILAVVTVLGIAGCEKYLDKAPYLGIDEEEVFSSYESIRGHLDRCYTYLERWMVTNQQARKRNGHPLAIADELATSLSIADNPLPAFQTGNWFSLWRNNDFEVGFNDAAPIYLCFAALRIANRVIENYEEVPNMTEQQLNEIGGQAYFYRAWFYFQLIKRLGGMPDLTYVMDITNWDIPRLTYRESHEILIDAIDKAIEMLPSSWDDANVGRPDKVAAMGVKSMAQLYAASPLMQNDLNTLVDMGYDTELALEAARNAQDVLEFIASNNTGRRLTDTQNGANMDAYKNIFWFKPSQWTHEEYIWWNRWYETAIDNDNENTIRVYWLWAHLDEFTGQDAASVSMPTYNVVKMFDRQGPDGNYYPTSDSRSGYVEGSWSAFSDRDPRLYNNILLPGERWGEWRGDPYYISSWVGGGGYENFYNNANSRNRQFTGFLAKKFIWPEANTYYGSTRDEGFFLYRFKTIYIRVSQIYLDYAEALFEATGSATTVPAGFNMSAADAVNVIRNRVGVTDLPSDIVNDPAKFREAYRRERAVELLFENQRWWDLRRWMAFDEVFGATYPIQNVIFTCDQGAGVDPIDFNDGKDLTFTWEVQDNTVEIRNYVTRNYWYPFPGAEVGSSDNITQNPGW
ncbi:MAG: RagB/SusD family nutrient uptake outer membrane protein [Alistipes sp.]|nr:RagB/SusD family nutrient uptake outer membrane protein [Alistipes sp.]